MRIKRIFVSILLLVALGLSACNNDSILPSNDNLNAIKPTDWEKIVEDSPYYLGDVELKQRVYNDGSVETYYQQDYGNYPCIDGSTALIPMAWEAFWQLLPSYSKFDISNKKYDFFADGFCRFSTTHEAYLNLIDKRPTTRVIYGKDYEPKEFVKAPDILLASAPSQAEKDYAAQQGVELIVNPIGYDSFVFITHKDNPVNSLTVEQVQDIYSGKITNWKDVGGKNQKITAYQREANSGSQTGMEQLVMKDKALMDAPTKLIISAMDGLVDVIAKYDNKSGSIGYTYKYYIKNLYTNSNIKIIKINGVEPSDENVRARTYPFVAKGNAVIRAEDLEKTGGIFMQWLMSEEGQKCIAQAGYAPAYI